MGEPKIKCIGQFEFKGVEVKIYHDPYMDRDSVIPVWQMRNPSSCYTGLMFANFKTGEVSYPEGAVVPEQTKEDREMLPKFVITGAESLDMKFMSNLKLYMDLEYLLRNP